MVTVHHLQNSRSFRIIWLLEELGIPYDIKTYERDTKTLLSPPELFKLHPLGQAPVITDNQFTIAESGAIIEYLIESYDPDHLLRPLPKTSERLDYTFWLHYAEGSLMPWLVMKLIFMRLSGPPVPWLIRPIATAISQGVQKGFIDKQIDIHMNFVDQSLKSTQNWLCGDTFSAADIQMYYPIKAASKRTNFSQYPALQEYIKRCESRPCHETALKKAGDVLLPISLK